MESFLNIIMHLLSEKQRAALYQNLFRLPYEAHNSEFEVAQTQEDLKSKVQSLN